MKVYLSLLTAALALTACQNEAAKSEQSSTATPPASVASASTASAAAAVPVPEVEEGCKIEVSSDDTMKFDKPELAIKSSCKNVAITLKNTGKAPKANMGHNIVIAKAADKDGILTDGANEGDEKNYLKPNDDRIIAATKLLGGGEEDTVVFPVSKLNKGEEYIFFCSFPGHYASMNGKVKLVD